MKLVYFSWNRPLQFFLVILYNTYVSREIHVNVGNRVVDIQQPYNSVKLLPFWSYTVPQWHFIRRKFGYYNWKKKRMEYRWDGKIKLLKNDRVPSGLFWSTYQDIEKELGKRFVIHHDSSTPEKRSSKHWLKSEGKYSFQNDCVDVMYGACNRGMGGLILNATGSGKTRIAAMFFLIL